MSHSKVTVVPLHHSLDLFLMSRKSEGERVSGKMEWAMMSDASKEPRKEGGTGGEPCLLPQLERETSTGGLVSSEQKDLRSIYIAKEAPSGISPGRPELEGVRAFCRVQVMDKM